MGAKLGDPSSPTVSDWPTFLLNTCNISLVSMQGSYGHNRLVSRNRHPTTNCQLASCTFFNVRPVLASFCPYETCLLL